MLSFEDRVGMGDSARTALERALGDFATLEDVVRWAFAERPPRNIADVVVQDEFSHDVIVGWGKVFLAFDTT